MWVWLEALSIAFLREVEAHYTGHVDYVCCHLQGLLAAGINIVTYVSPIDVARKDNGKVCMCIEHNFV